MTPALLNRRVHYWLSAAVALPLAVIVVTGLLLQLKKQVSWVQPSEQRGGGKEPRLTMPDVLAACRQVSEAGVGSWEDITRMDVRPARGLVKVQTRSGYEVQLDAATGAVLQVAYRRSDLIESFHDGSAIGGWAKYGLFLPAGVSLLVLWGTGVVLFARPLWVKWRRQAAARRNA